MRLGAAPLGGRRPCLPPPRRGAVLLPSTRSRTLALVDGAPAQPATQPHTKRRTQRARHPAALAPARAALVGGTPVQPHTHERRVKDRQCNTRQQHSLQYVPRSLAANHEVRMRAQQGAPTPCGPRAAGGRAGRAGVAAGGAAACGSDSGVHRVPPAPTDRRHAPAHLQHAVHGPPRAEPDEAGGVAERDVERGGGHEAARQQQRGRRAAAQHAAHKLAAGGAGGKGWGAGGGRPRCSGGRARQAPGRRTSRSASQAGHLKP